MTIQRLYTVDEVGAVAHSPRGTVLYWIYSGTRTDVVRILLTRGLDAAQPKRKAGRAR